MKKWIVFCLMGCCLGACQSTEDWKENMSCDPLSDAEDACGAQTLTADGEEHASDSTDVDVDEENGTPSDATGDGSTPVDKDDADDALPDEDVPDEALPDEDVPETTDGTTEHENAEDLPVECEHLVLCDETEHAQNCCSPQPVPIDAPGLTNLYQLSANFYRSGQPSDGGLTSAKSLGIRTALSLQLVNMDSVYEAEEQTGLALEHVPMVPWLVSEDDLVSAMRVIHAAEKPILVHCLHGSDRTGLVVAMYRILFEGWTRDMARFEMTQGGFGYHEEFHNLVETLDSISIETMQERVFGDQAGSAAP